MQLVLALIATGLGVVMVVFRKRWAAKAQQVAQHKKRSALYAEAAKAVTPASYLVIGAVSIGVGIFLACSFVLG